MYPKQSNSLQGAWVILVALLLPQRYHGCPQTPAEPKVIKKRTKKYIWHQARHYVKIKQNWQEPKGTDYKVCERFRARY